jgi:hypothetical protein
MRNGFDFDCLMLIVGMQAYDSVNACIVGCNKKSADVSIKTTATNDSRGLDDQGTIGVLLFLLAAIGNGLYCFSYVALNMTNIVVLQASQLTRRNGMTITGREEYRGFIWRSWFPRSTPAVIGVTSEPSKDDSVWLEVYNVLCFRTTI